MRLHCRKKRLSALPTWFNIPVMVSEEISSALAENNRGFSFERHYVLHWWESETVKSIINHNVNK